MKRPNRSARRQFAVETLELRALLTTTTSGVSPLAIPVTSSTPSIFVRFAADDPLIRQQADLQTLKASVVTSYPDGPELIKLGVGVSPSLAIQQLQADPGVIYASLDSTIHAASTPFLPNDPALGQQWGLNSPNNVDIDAPEAWAVTDGTAATIIAVIDTGIDVNNPDFAGRIWTNPRNDVRQGFPNDVHGWNFLDNTPNIQDDNGHGTHVSAIIGATANNAFGVAGIDLSAQIMPLKFLDANGNGTTDEAVSAVYFAVNHGAKVINASWGGQAYSAPLNDAIAYANSHNVVFVTAAGNDSANNDTTATYPASYRTPNELSVASVDQNGGLASFSNYGAGTVDLAAPGVGIVSDVPTSIDPSGYETLSGTSMSAAYVSGVAALISGLNPSFTAAQIVNRIDTTTKSLPSLAGRTISGGMVDAFNAIEGSKTPGSSSTSPGSTGTSIGSTGTSSAISAGIPSLALGSTSQATIQASILASDEYFAVQGGSASGFISGLYNDILARGPDAGGLQYWEGVYNSGTVTRFQIALGFVNSLEGRLTEVARWYQQDLERSDSLATLKADPGVAGWASQLLAGAGDNSIEASIVSSPEYLTEHGTLATPVIQAFYQTFTDRSADGGGLAYWVGQLNTGVPAYNVIRSFQGANEVGQTLVASWYSLYLGRKGTIAQLKADSGVQGWVNELGNF